MKVISLEQCPFCGGKAKFVDYGEEGEFEDWDIECESCHILFIAPGKESGDVTTKEEVATAWNRRHPIVVLDELSSSEEN